MTGTQTELSVMIRQRYQNNREFAKALDITPEALSMINRKHLLPTPKTMALICEKLEIVPSDYWTRKELTFEGLERKPRAEQKKRRRVCLELTDLYESVQEISEAEGESMADWIREQIRRGVNEYREEHRELELMKMA